MKNLPHKYASGGLKDIPDSKPSQRTRYHAPLPFAFF
jgi:hypothetical protein